MVLRFAHVSGASIDAAEIAALDRRIPQRAVEDGYVTGAEATQELHMPARDTAAAGENC